MRELAGVKIQSNFGMFFVPLMLSYIIFTAPLVSVAYLPLGHLNFELQKNHIWQKMQP